MKLLNIFCSNQNSKLKHSMIQFRLHNIHISDQTQLAMINMSLKWQHINICENKLLQVDILTQILDHLNSFRPLAQTQVASQALLVRLPRLGLNLGCQLCCLGQHATQGESTIQGGQLGHFHNMYVMYIFAKHVAFNFGFHFWCLGLIFLFSQI